MNKYRLILAGILLTSILNSSISVFAHATQNTFTSLYIDTNVEAEELDSKSINGTLSINSLDFSILIEKDDKPEDIFSGIESEAPFTESYLSENFKMSNNNTPCGVNFSMQIPASQESFLISGVSYQIDIVCNETLGELLISNTAFLDIFPSTLNIIQVYDGPETFIGETALTSEQDCMSITENDTVYSASNVSCSNPESGVAQETTQPTATPDSGNTDALVYRISELLENRSVGTIALILLIIVLIGSLHALEGGHSKLILASLLLKKEIQYKDSIIYVLIFTITHMSDIIILAVALLVFEEQINIYSRLPDIQLYSGYILVFLAVVIVIKELRQILKVKKAEQAQLAKVADTSEIEGLFESSNYRGENDKAQKQENNDGKTGNTVFKEQFMVAFVSGLAPCLTGWAIFVLIVSTGAVWLLIPATIAFGVGVFIVLLLFALLINQFKEKIVNRFDTLSKWSSLVSGVLLLVTALFFVL